MKNHDATEQAYKNGYEAGYEAGKRDAVKHGRWIEQPQMADMYSKYYLCSVCGAIDQVSHNFDIKVFYPYCHCGARMDLEDD